MKIIRPTVLNPIVYDYECVFISDNFSILSIVVIGNLALTMAGWIAFIIKSWLLDPFECRFLPSTILQSVKLEEHHREELIYEQSIKISSKSA
jgi:hypothetical protein